MTCGSAREALLDLARGVAMAERERLAVETHVSTCPACAADLERHRDLTAALQALSAEAQAWRASPEIEHRLQAAFEAERTASVPLSGSAPQTERWVYALAMAAIVALAVWIGSRAPRPPVAPATAAAPAPSPAPTSAPPRGSAPAVAALHSTERPTVSRPRSSRPKAAPAPRVRSFEFVALPSAVGLPDFESGSVVRIQVPVAALPGYGVDVVPNMQKATVEADVLVGQDGQPRAIRLVADDEQLTRDVRSKP
jgi:hypothetical protein